MDLVARNRGGMGAVMEGGGQDSDKGSEGFDSARQVCSQESATLRP